MPFLRNSPTGGARRRILCMMAQMMRTRARMCLSWGFLHMAAHLRGQKPQFWDVNTSFQAKLVKSINVHIIKTTASISTKFCTVIKITKCPLWVVPTHVSQIQDSRACRPLKIWDFENRRWRRTPSWKSKITTSRPWYKRFRQNLAQWCRV